MRRFLTVLLGCAAIAAIAEPAAARDGCGRGFAWNGYACVPMQAPAPYYAPGYGPGPGYGGGYGGPPAYGYYRGGGGAIQGESSTGRQETWFRPYRDADGQPHCRQPGYTLQDGVCKRYRGY